MEFFNMFSYHFIQRALIVGVLVSLCAALLGVSLVLKRYSMIGDGLSHVGFGALAIASAFNLAPLAVTIPVVVAAAVLLLRMSKNGMLKGDTAIAMISSSSIAIGVVVISLVNGINSELNSYMFGSILSVSRSDAVLSIILCSAVLVLFLLLYPRLFAVTFDEDFARATGTNTELYKIRPFRRYRTIMRTMIRKMPITAALTEVDTASWPRVAETLSTFCWVSSSGKAPDWILAAMVVARSALPRPLITPEPLVIALCTVGAISCSPSR